MRYDSYAEDRSYSRILTWRSLVLFSLHVGVFLGVLLVGAPRECPANVVVRSEKLIYANSRKTAENKKNGLFLSCFFVFSPPLVAVRVPPCAGRSKLSITSLRSRNPPNSTKKSID